MWVTTTKVTQHTFHDKPETCRKIQELRKMHKANARHKCTSKMNKNQIYNTTNCKQSWGSPQEQQTQKEQKNTLGSMQKSLNMHFPQSTKITRKYETFNLNDMHQKVKSKTAENTTQPHQKSIVLPRKHTALSRTNHPVKSPSVLGSISEESFTMSTIMISPETRHEYIPLWPNNAESTLSASWVSIPRPTGVSYLLTLLTGGSFGLLIDYLEVFYPLNLPTQSLMPFCSWTST